MSAADGCAARLMGEGRRGWKIERRMARSMGTARSMEMARIMGMARSMRMASSMGMARSVGFGLDCERASERPMARTREGRQPGKEKNRGDLSAPSKQVFQNQRCSPQSPVPPPPRPPVIVVDVALGRVFHPVLVSGYRLAVMLPLDYLTIPAGIE